MSPSPYDRPYPDPRSLSSTAIFELDGHSVKNRAPSKASKRIRGEIACAECRRLKIRCDRTVPCSTCVKRGCGALCPNGTVPPGEGSRFVLAATDHLHQKLTRMEARMHALEDALAILHATDSDNPHPLLLSRDYDSDEDQTEDEPTLNLKAVSEEPSQESTLADALGSLHIDSEGGSRFFGPSGGSESLLLQAKGMEALSKSGPFRTRDLDPSYLPPEINQLCRTFPFRPPGIPRNSVQEMIESFLPPLERAIILCETFLEHLSWMCRIVSRRQLIEELIPAIYKQVRATYGPHELALLLITLGIGALVDLDLLPYNLESQHYYRLAQAALTLQSVMTEPSVTTIKTLHLMSIYNGLSGKEANMEASYGLLDMASRGALTLDWLALDLDPSMWGFAGREAYERRIYFYNLLVAVLWQSMVTGRPPTILSVYVDCKLPTEREEHEYNNGAPPVGLGVWGHMATQECLLPIVHATMAVKAPSYEQVLRLDRIIRNFAQPTASPVGERTAISMKNFIRSHYMDLMLLFLHRAFFAQVMIEDAADPMKSPYAHSVLAAYQGACSVLDHTLEQFTKRPLLVSRVWRIWSLAFSAAVVVGTLAIRGINLQLNPLPLEKFQTACNMFRSAAETSSRAARALPVLQTMLAKAYHARQLHAGEPVPVASPDDEISIFGGRAGAVVHSSPASSSPSPKRKESPSVPSHSRQATVTQATMRPPRASAPAAPMTIPEPPLSAFGPRNGADPQQSWEGLFREAPGSSYGMQENPIDGGAMDDRWSSFMHSYDILQVDEPQPLTPRLI